MDWNELSAAEGRVVRTNWEIVIDFLYEDIQKPQLELSTTVTIPLDMDGLAQPHAPQAGMMVIKTILYLSG
jgi:hypothetical protein